MTETELEKQLLVTHQGSRQWLPLSQISDARLETFVLQYAGQAANPQEIAASEHLLWAFRERLVTAAQILQWMENHGLIGQMQVSETPGPATADEKTNDMRREQLIVYCDAHDLAYKDKDKRPFRIHQLRTLVAAHMNESTNST